MRTHVRTCSTTNVFAAVAQPKPHRGVERAITKHAAEFVTTSLVVHQMWFGVERLPPSRRRTDAAVAAVHDATVVTGKEGHFTMLEDLRVENWSASVPADGATPPV